MHYFWFCLRFVIIILYYYIINILFNPDKMNTAQNESNCYLILLICGFPFAWREIVTARAEIMFRRVCARACWACMSRSWSICKCWHCDLWCTTVSMISVLTQTERDTNKHELKGLRISVLLFLGQMCLVMRTQRRNNRRYIGGPYEPFLLARIRVHLPYWHLSTAYVIEVHFNN